MIKIPEGTSRPLGAPAKGHKWSEEVVREGFKSEPGLTANRFPWIIEEAAMEAIETPHPGNCLNVDRKMVTSISYKQELDEVNGYLVRGIRDQERGIIEDDSLSQVGQDED
eukprot:1895384-Amphidinium_carterae.3